jgi:hypothetical protein
MSAETGSSRLLGFRRHTKHWTFFAAPPAVGNVLIGRHRRSRGCCRALMSRRKDILWAKRGCWSFS